MQKNNGKVFSILGAIFLPTGILSTIGGVISFFIWLIVAVFSATAQGCVSAVAGNEETTQAVIDNTFLYIAIPLFLIGVSLIVCGIVFLVIGKKKKQQQKMSDIETLHRD